jgi:branched-chain amino acid transport system permease protein
VAMIIVGGIGSWGGSIIGAAFVVLLPELIQRLGEFLNIPNVLSAMRELAFGLLIIMFLVFEPRGLAALLRRLTPRAAAAAAVLLGRKEAWKPESASRRRA